MFRKFVVFIVGLYMRCRFKVDLVNYERFEKIKTGCILAPNHISAWETVMMPALSKKVMHMMAKEEIFKNKFVAWFFKEMKVFPIARKKNDLGAIKTCVKLLKDGKSICMFPEGTRSKDKTLDFKTGVSMIAHSAKVPVIPVGIVAENDFKFRSKVHIVYGEPIYFTDYYDKKINKEDLVNMTEKVKNGVIKAIKSVEKEL